MKYLIMVLAFDLCLIYLGFGVAIYQAHTPNGLKCREMGGHYYLWDNTCKTEQQFEMK